jgi:hypothetical protein
MTEADITKLQKQFKIKFPETYVAILRDCIEYQKRLPPALAAKRPEHLITDVNALTKLNQDVRQSPGKFIEEEEKYHKAWPPHFFLCGYDIYEDYLVLDCSKKNPKLLTLSGSGDGVDTAVLPETLSQLKDWCTKHWKELEAKVTQPAVPTPNLVAIARTLARPAVVLTKRGKDYAAIWRGAGVVPGPKGDWEHLISVDCTKLPLNPRKLKGVLSVYESTGPNNFRCEHVVHHDPKARLPAKTDGVKLFGSAYSCPPPPNALLEEGPREVNRWSDSKPLDYQETVQAYVNHYFKHYPPNGHAMLGGWSDPMGHEIEKWMKTLLLITFEDAEPFVEVWDDGKRLRAYGRIS